MNSSWSLSTPGVTGGSPDGWHRANMTLKTFLGRILSAGPDSPWGPCRPELWSGQGGCSSSGWAENSQTVTNSNPACRRDGTFLCVVAQWFTETRLFLVLMNVPARSDCPSGKAHLNGIYMIRILSLVHPTYEQQVESIKYLWSAYWELDCVRLEHCPAL